MFFKSPSPSNSPARSTPPYSPPRPLPDSSVEENLQTAHFLITKWDSDTSPFAKITSLFHDNRQEAKQYLNAVKELHNTMRYLVTVDSSRESLVGAQHLMQMAMKRLQKEFYQILSTNRAHLDPESLSARSSKASTTSTVSDYEDDVCSEDEFQFAGDSIKETERVSLIAMADMKSIAECMIFSGYGKECVKIYKVIRKSIVDEGLYHLGIEKNSLSKIQKMEWEVLEIKIKSWSHAVKVAVRTLFYGERILCDQVFSNSEAIRESCFAEISKEGALSLFGFPEMVGKCKKSPEKMFRILDMYESVSNLWPEIESIFFSELTSDVRSQAVNSLIQLGEAVRYTLTDFETAIKKDPAKATIAGGGVHPITRYVMNYLTFLADYSGILEDIVTDWPMPLRSPSPESYLGSPDAGDIPSSAVSVHISWLILVLLCKIDGKAELYKNVALSYLFLANNLQYIVGKVLSSKLMFLLGEGWVSRHESKVKRYAANYERMGWSKVLSSLPENRTAEISPEQAMECFGQFNAAFEESWREQVSWIVSDSKLRENIKVSLARKLVPAYREFYEKHRAGLRSDMGLISVIRFAPDDLENYLSDILYGTGGSSSVSSSSSTSCQRRSWRGH